MQDDRCLGPVGKTGGHRFEGWIGNGKQQKSLTPGLEPIDLGRRSPEQSCQAGGWLGITTSYFYDLGAPGHQPVGQAGTYATRPDE